MIQSYVSMWKNMWDVKGRARRDTFWEAFLGNIFIVCLLVMFSICFGRIAISVQICYQVIYIIPFISLSIRRLHDTGKSGKFIFLNFIPFVGNVIFFYIMMEASVPEDNRYGASPYERGEKNQLKMVKENC